MNSIEILYQVFRARVSLSQVQEALDTGFSMALVRLGDNARSLSWLGEHRALREGEENPSKFLELRWPWTEAPAGLKDCKGAVVDLGDQPAPVETLREIARALPVCVPCLWFYVNDTAPLALGEPDLTLPRLHRIDSRDPAPVYCRLLMRAFPDVAVNLARDYSMVRFLYARGLIKRVSRRNAMLAAASTVSAPPIPIVGTLWGFFATTGETMAITASQLRLCLLMAAIHGRALDFFDRVGELWPIIGSAFGWRALAREMVGFIPAAGWAFKTGLAYSGTYMVGESSRLYFEHGQPGDEESMREIKRLGKQRAMKAVGEALKNARDQLLKASEDEVAEPDEAPAEEVTSPSSPAELE